MGFPSSEVSYTSATTGRGDHEVHKGLVVALAKKKVVVEEGLLNVGNFLQTGKDSVS
jgi:hypothetical protein